MTLHTAGYFENQDGAATIQPIAALVDPYVGSLMPVEATDYLKVDGALPLLIGLHAHVDATVQPRARLSQPSFRERYGLPYVEVPVLSSTAEPGSPHAYNDLRANPIVLKGGERLLYETLNDPAAAADQFAVGVFASAVPAPVSPAGFVCVRFVTAAAACSANTWNARAISAADGDLLAGEYEVIGGYAISTSLIAARLAFPGSSARPPIAAKDARTDVVHPFFQPGQLGVLGKFHSTNLPQVELLTDTTDNEVQVVDLWVRRVGAAK